MNEVRIAAAAEHDYATSLLWYAERSAEAAEGFEVEFARALTAIAADPNRFPLWDERHRFYLLQRYPFQIVFRCQTEEEIWIVAVAHTSRRPGYWQGK